MKQKRFLGIYCTGAVFALALFGSSTLWAQTTASFSLPTVNVFQGGSVDLALKIDAGGDDLQGFMAAIELSDGSLGGFTFVDISPIGPPTPSSASLGNGADQIVGTIVPGGNAAVVGAVFDLDVLDNGGVAEIMDAGNTHLAAIIEFTAGGTTGTTDVNFDLDAEYAADQNQNGPAVHNIVVIGSQSYDQSEGLGLNNGKINVLDTPPGTYTVVSDMGMPGDNSKCIDVTLDSSQPVQGFVIALQHDSSKVELASIPFPSQDGSSIIDGGQAEFVDHDIFADGGVVSVIMDFVADYDNQTIDGTGAENNVVATFCYDVVDDPDDHSDCAGEPPVEGSPTVADLTFVDLVLDIPVKENVAVIGGLSKNVETINGTVTFKPEPCVQCVREHTFACGGELVSAARCTDPITGEPGGFALEAGGFDVDPSSPDPSGAPGPLSGQQGENIEVCFYYTSPPTGPVDESDDEDNAADVDDIQGLSMSVWYDTGLKCLGTWSVENTITDAVGADFINVDCTDDPGGMGGGRLIIGILVDFLPPFDGQTLPPTLDFLKVISVDFQICDEVPCGDELCVEFHDCDDPMEKPCIKNLISAMNSAIAPRLFRCCVTVQFAPDFVRGDCNFSAEPGMEGMSVDIADPASVISHLFLTGAWKFEPPCLDACDCNDDGRIDLADAVCILVFLFNNPMGNDLEPPGAMTSGPDETEDKLDCAGEEGCPNDT
jgi:hypothetical protein